MYRLLFFRFTDAFLTLNPVALAATLTGGRNIGAEYFADPVDDPKVFRDMDVLLEGKESGARNGRPSSATGHFFG